MKIAGSPIEEASGECLHSYPHRSPVCFLEEYKEVVGKISPEIKKKKHQAGSKFYFQS
jgi:hypothetical protein